MKTPSSADSLRTHDTAAPVELTDAQLDQVTGGGGNAGSIDPGDRGREASLVGRGIQPPPIDPPPG
jgi:hypothetical protein